MFTIISILVLFSPVASEGIEEIKIGLVILPGLIDDMTGPVVNLLKKLDRDIEEYSFGYINYIHLPERTWLSQTTILTYLSLTYNRHPAYFLILFFILFHPQSQAFLLCSTQYRNVIYCSTINKRKTHNSFPLDNRNEYGTRQVF